VRTDSRARCNRIVRTAAVATLPTSCLARASVSGHKATQMAATTAEIHGSHQYLRTHLNTPSCEIDGNQIAAELDARKASLLVLQQDAKTAEALAAMHRDQAEAVRRMLDAELAARLATLKVAIRNDVKKDSVRLGIGSFIAGGGLTLLITLLVHPLQH
jgi:hypothetical protein